MDRKANIYDIARLTGTTITAVSRAFDPKGKIDPEKRARILEVAEKYNYRPNRAAGRLSRKTIKIGCVLIANIPEYYSELIAGVNSACSKLSDFKVECDVRLVTPGEEEEACCGKIFGYYLENGFDGVIMNIKYSPAVMKWIERLQEAGIPCATVTSDAPGSKRLFSVQNDLCAAGRIASELLSVMTGNGRVLLFTGERDSYVQEHILGGFKREARERGLLILDEYDTGDNPKFAGESACRAFEQYPDVDGVYISSANSVPVIEQIKKKGLSGRVKIVASDVFPELSEAMTAGVVDATIYQNPFGQAELAFEKMYDYITQRKLEKPVYTVIPQIVIKSNLYLYTSNRE